MNTFFRSVSRFLIAAGGLMSLAIASPAQTTAAPQSSTVVEREINMQTPPTAQAPTPEKAQTRRPGRRPVPPATVTMVADQTRVAPQVVTIVHRLSGVKMLRFLLRQGGEPGIVYQIDPESISSDAHASIIAGWALEDGKTIAVRLPQAGAELEFSRELLMPPPLPGVSPATSGPAFSFPRTEPDLWVITRDGRKLRARYIGLDGETGLSVLQVSPMVQAPVAEEAASMLAQGQSVQIFAPERTAPETGAATRNIYVRVGKIDAKIVELSSSNTDKPPELTVRGYGLSPLFVGGVACDEAGNTLGLVESIDGDNAHIVPADNIRAAARRVLERRASVPKPLLGVVGEPVDLAARAAFLAHGWSEDQFKALLEKHLGILLTTVRPGTPAALAKLHAGDLIVRVNQDDIASGEEFSKSLGKAGSGQLVQFLVRRPGTPDPFAIDVKLGGSFEQVFKYRWEYPELPATRPSGLEGLGVETIAVSTKNLSQIGVETGLLIVAVAPDSVAARGGIREGDVIESIDGRILGRDARGAGLELKPGKRHVLSVIRNREKKQVILEGID